MDKISVIIPVYNVEKFLPQCLESVIGQDYKNLEIICVDDGSPDNCGKILDDYALKDNRIKVVHQKNKGLSQARNLALDMASGDWISFVDSDDFLAPDFYDVMLNAAKENNADVVQCGAYFYDNKIIKTIAKKSIISGNFIDIVQGFERGYVWNKLWKRQLIERNNLRFHPDIFLEDLLFSIMAATFIEKFQAIPYVGYFYRKNPNSVTQLPEKKAKMKQDCFYVLCKTLNFAKDKKMSKGTIEKLSDFLIDNLVTYKDLQQQEDYKKFVAVLGKRKWLVLKRAKAVWKNIIGNLTKRMHF